MNLKFCDNPKLRDLGYRRINFLSHQYFMFYRNENDTVYVENIQMGRSFSMRKMNNGKEYVDYQQEEKQNQSGTWKRKRKKLRRRSLCVQRQEMP